MVEEDWDQLAVFVSTFASLFLDLFIEFLFSFATFSFFNNMKFPIQFTVAIFLGVWNCFSIITIDITCLISGMWQIVAGFLLLCCEAPCCCLFIDHVQRLSEALDKRPYWNKAAGYVG